jgi:hypothetical protein
VVGLDQCWHPSVRGFPVVCALIFLFAWKHGELQSFSVLFNTTQLNQCVAVIPRFSQATEKQGLDFSTHHFLIYIY